MLTEQERRELKDLASSSAVREEFRRLKAASLASQPGAVNLDRLLNFLTTMSRFSPPPSSTRQPILYKNARL